MSRIEAKASIDVLEKSNFPARLESCKTKLGQDIFQKLLREEIYNPILGYLKIAEMKYPGNGEKFPSEFRQIAKLGQLANPIVNFNIEQFTSYAIAGSGGPFSMRCFRRADDQYLPREQMTFFSEGGDTDTPRPSRFSRIVYHPHGMLDLSGLCIMCKDEYDAMHGSLALKLAIHLAFDSYLVIVGMSLNDAYLREQLSRYSEYYVKIIWFSRPEEWSPSIKRWVQVMHRKEKIEIGIVKEWTDFWKAVDKYLPSPPPNSITKAWSKLAQRVKNPGSETARVSSRNPLLAGKFKRMLGATGESS